MKIANQTVAAIEFTLTDGEGKLLESTSDHGPHAYLHGSQSLLPGLEAELEGKTVGDRFEVRLEPEDAYGERDEELVQAVGRDHLPKDIELEIGMELSAETEDGEEVVTVVGFEGDRVVLDGNHPLAGVTLCFDVEVVEVRAATRQELAHGHVHGPGGHGH